MLIPQIVFPGPMEPFGDVVFKPGAPWSFDDPGHQRVFKQLIERSGARVTFVTADPATGNTAANSDALDSSVAVCLGQIDAARKVLADFKANRQGEIDRLTKELSDLKAEVLVEAKKQVLGNEAPTEAQALLEAQLKTYLGTATGATHKDQRDWIESRIAKVKALIAAADAGTDDTVQVSQANTAIVYAQRRIKDVQEAKAALLAAMPTPAPADPVAILAAFEPGSLLNVKGIGKLGDQLIAAAREAVAARPAAPAPAPAGTGPAAQPGAGTASTPPPSP